MLEKSIESYLKKRVKEKGGIAIKFVPLAFTGLPDRIVLLPQGRIWFVELKAENGRTSKRQAFVQNMLTQLGFSCLQLNSKWKIDLFINEL